jgi:hypothetical protein
MPRRVTQDYYRVKAINSLGCLITLAQELHEYQFNGDTSTGTVTGWGRTSRRDIRMATDERAANKASVIEMQLCGTR